MLLREAWCLAHNRSSIKVMSEWGSKEKDRSAAHSNPTVAARSGSEGT